ncbi:MAG: histidine kinase [Bacteroidota bacterium]
MTKLYHWLYKYKIYHLPFWCIYHYLWWSLSSNPFEAVYNIFYSPYTIKFLFYVVLQAVGVYFNLYFLIPRFLEKGRYIPYVTSVAATIFVTATLIIGGYYVTAWWNQLPFEELFDRPAWDFMFFFKFNSLPSTAASMTLAMSIKLTKNWIESKQRAQILEKEKLETELKFLKGQFNPHFLFNTINSIFVLIHKNPDRASESLAKFSNLMRYQLYDCNAQQIPLQQELSYLENFIELEELRQEATFDLDVQIDEDGYSQLMIAPFLLMPFVENAFKHVSQSQERKNWIKIRVRTQDSELFFSIKNSVTAFPKNHKEIVTYGGLGLKNVQRRLALLYPDQYQLIIDQRATFFEVTLRLTLTSEKVSVPIL